MLEYRCKNCDKLLFKADLEHGVVKTKCPACGAFLEVLGDYNMLEGKRVWREFKVDCGFENLVVKYDADENRVQYAEEYAPRVYALYRRLHPNAKIRFEATEDKRKTYFAVYIKIDDMDGSGYFPYHRELIGLFDSPCECEFDRI